MNSIADQPAIVKPAPDRLIEFANGPLEADREMVENRQQKPPEWKPGATGNTRGPKYPAGTAITRP
jgi:hypothetical protein